MIVLTPEHIEQLRTPQGGFNQETMELIGEWPLVAGWQERLIGQKVADRKWKAALKAKTGQRHFYRGNTRKHR
jgi:hypothetical protein